MAIAFVTLMIKDYVLLSFRTKCTNRIVLKNIYLWNFDCKSTFDNQPCSLLNVQHLNNYI